MISRPHLTRDGSIVLVDDAGRISCPCTPASFWIDQFETKLELTIADILELLRREQEALARHLSHDALVARATVRLLNARNLQLR